MLYILNWDAAYLADVFGYLYLYLYLASLLPSLSAEVYHPSLSLLPFCGVREFGEFKRSFYGPTSVLFYSFAHNLRYIIVFITRPYI